MMDKLSTVLVEPGSHCDVTSDGDLEITLGASSDASKRSGVSTDLDMIQLSIFSHRFMSIAEQVCPLTHDIFFWCLPKIFCCLGGISTIVLHSISIIRVAS